MAAGVTPDGLNWFEFRTAPYADTIRVEWPKDAPIALFENDVSVAMINAGYGFHPAEEAIAEYNKLAAETPNPPSAPVAIFPPEGWLPHPQTPGYFYKDQEVLTEAQLRERTSAAQS